MPNKPNALHLLGNDDYPNDSYLIKYITPRDDIWVDLEFHFPYQRLIDQWFWYPFLHITSNHVYHSGSFSNDWLSGVEADASWNSTQVYCQDEGFNTGGSVLIAKSSLRDVWNTLRVNVVKNVTCDSWIDSTVIQNGTGEFSGNQIQAVIIGQPSGGAPIWIRKVKIGTTGAGSSDILLEDWSTGDFSNWDVNNVIGLSGLDFDPLQSPVPFNLTPNTVDEIYNGQRFDVGTERLALRPSSTDIEDIQDVRTEVFALKPSGAEIGPWSDSGIELFKFTPSTDEHYCPEKVSVEGSLDSRWEASSETRWPGSMQSRWEGTYLGIGEGFAC